MKSADKKQTNKDPQTYEVIGAAMEVHHQLGHGFLEAVYQEALAIEMTKRNIPFEREVAVPVEYKGQRLQCSYRADFVCFKEVVVELKAINQLTGADDAQLINELKATGLHRGLLLNFGAPSLEYKRLVSDLRETNELTCPQIAQINADFLKK
jgi:GxxExxY protein